MAKLRVIDFDYGKEDLDFVDTIKTSTNVTETSRLGTEYDTRITRLKKGGYIPATAGGAWAAGVTFTNYEQFLIFNDKVYIVDETVNVPVVTGATPDSNFKIMISVHDDDIKDIADNYNEVDLQQFTSICFDDVAQMQTLTLTNGRYINIQLGRSLKVKDEEGYFYTYEVINSGQIGPEDTVYLLANGLYAREYEYARDPNFGNPLKNLDTDENAMNSLLPNIQTIDYSTGLSGISQLTNAVLGQNGKVYFGPGTTNVILSYDTKLKVFEQIAISTASASPNWKGGILAPNGMLYFPPASGCDEILVFNTQTTETSLIAGVGSGNDFDGGCLHENGSLYCIGTSSTEFVLKIDPDTDTFNLISKPKDPGETYANEGWAGCAIAANGKLYAAPKQSKFFLEFDVDTETTNYFYDTGASGTGDVFKDIVVGPDGFLYAVPGKLNDVYQVNPNTLAVNTSFVTLEAGTGQKTDTAICGANGLIYALPGAGSGYGILEIDVYNASSRRISYSASGTFKGFCLGDNGSIISKSTAGWGLILNNADGSELWTKSAYVANNS